MKTTTCIAAVLAAATCALVAPTTCIAQQKNTANAAAKPMAQKAFPSSEDAVKALVDAVRAADVEKLYELMGAGSKSWLSSGDRVSDAADWKRFLAAYDEKNSIVKEGDAKAVLEVGKDDWPFPAPLVKKEQGWVFDSDAGREEVLNRRVGRNELDAAQTLLAIVDAQREYAALDAARNGLAVYAMKFASSPGKKDGLYWPTKAGEPESPLGPLVASAVKSGYGGQSASAHRAYHGYYYRILVGQGKDAPGGAFDYRVNGKLFGGFAVVAWPASYGNSGVQTFVVNHAGVVYAKDLGPNTAAEAEKMELFNPGPGWKKMP
ncbi:MAG TPA: DUF2950 domain-containing protein [Caldimonas sp.]|nr:DUF2950 domain-containing protein [Caldimonas sp.]HEX4232720.1 DUF2950 domain-containing protein [Caldimonas sp.]